MQKKVIVFDVDGVIIDSVSKKYLAFRSVVEQFWLIEDISVKQVLDQRVTRYLLAEKIYEVSWIHPQKTLAEISRLLALYEAPWKIYPTFKETINFIKQNHEKYIFFTNTAMDTKTVYSIFQPLWIIIFFEEILGYDTGTKRENIEYILRDYNPDPKNILFIDDLQSNIDSVAPTWVHTLLFSGDWVSLEAKVWNIFWL